MKKFNRFVRTIPMKIYILLAAVIVLGFFSNDFGLVDIQKTAIILAAGIDRRDDGFTVSALISVPKSGNATTGSSSSVEIEGEGETVCACFDDIFNKTGWVPKLVFCNLVVLGEETVKEDINSALEFFLRNEYMPDTCLLATCEGTAAELLKTTSAIEDTSSSAIGKLFSEASAKSGNVVTNTLREFAIGYFGVSASGYMPYIQTVEYEGPDNSSGTDAPESSGANAGGEKKVTYTAENTAAFSHGKMVALLNKDETFAFSLLLGKVNNGIISVQDEDAPVSLIVLREKGGYSLDMKSAPKAKLKVEIYVQLHSRGVPTPIEDITHSMPSETVQQNARDSIRQSIASIWDKTTKNNCDLFFIIRDLYRSSVKKYEEWKDTLLSVAQLEAEVIVKSVK